MHQCWILCCSHDIRIGCQFSQQVRSWDRQHKQTTEQIFLRICGIPPIAGIPGMPVFPVGIPPKGAPIPIGFGFTGLLGGLKAIAGTVAGIGWAGGTNGTGEEYQLGEHTIQSNLVFLLS